MQRNPVDAGGLERFLQRLGRCYRHAGSFYVTGGSSLLLVAAKMSTFDIDVDFDVSPEHRDELIRCLREVGREMNISVELASPGHFIPLPSGHRERRRFIGRYGTLDVFHFDFYSVALSKIHRGNEEDLADVVSMIGQDVIDAQAMEQYLLEILPALESFSPSADPADFQRKFALFKQRLAGAS